MAYPTNPGTAHMPAPAQPPSNNRKKIVVIATCIAVAFAIANGILIFKLTSDSSDDTASGDDSSSSQPESDDGDATAPAEPDGPPQVSFDYPDGYQKNSGLTLLTPLYSEYEETFLTDPDSDDPNESLFVVSYATDDTTADMSEDDQIAMVENYAVDVGDTGDSPPESTTDIGHQAILDGITVKNPSGDEIKYAAYFIFADNALIQIGCQGKSGGDFTQACVYLAMSISY